MALGKSNLEVLAEYNPWWQGGKVRSELLGAVERPHCRQILAHLQSQRQILLLEGPRRVGKTTLLYQTIAHLLAAGVSPQTIVYASVDDPYFDPQTLLPDLEAYLARHVVKGELATAPAPLYLFLDEITALLDWERYLKRYYDLGYPLRFVCSSSAAALLRRRSRESLAGRMATLSVYPFSFSETATLRGLARDLAAAHARLLPLWQAFFQGGELAILARELEALQAENPPLWRHDLPLRLYLLEGGFPEYLTAQAPGYKETYFTQGVVERALFHDVGPILGATDLALLERLFLYANNQSGAELNLSEASRNLGVPRSTLANYLRHLGASGLLYSLPKYARSVETQMRSLERVYAIDPGLYLSLARISPPELERTGAWGKLAEIVVLSELKRQGLRHLWYWREREAEVDFVLEQAGGQGLIAIEVKFRSDPLAAQGLRGLNQFTHRFQPRCRVIVSKDTLKMADPQTLVVPLSMFLS